MTELDHIAEIIYSVNIGWLHTIQKKGAEKYVAREDKLIEEYNKALITKEVTPLLRKMAESLAKEKYRFREEENERLGYIYDIKTIADKLKLGEKSTRNLISKNFEKPFEGWEFVFHEVQVIKAGTRILLKKQVLHDFISKNSYKYEKGIKISPCNYDRLPEYLKIDDCAVILKLENGRQFRRNYIDNNPARLEGVEILKIGSTVRIEQESFLRYVETLGGETAK